MPTNRPPLKQASIRNPIILIKGQVNYPVQLSVMKAITVEFLAMLFSSRGLPANVYAILTMTDCTKVQSPILNQGTVEFLNGGGYCAGMDLFCSTENNKSEVCDNLRDMARSRWQMIVAPVQSPSRVPPVCSPATDRINPKEDIMRTAQVDQNAPEPTNAPLVAVVADDASVGRSTQRLLCCSGLRAEAYTSAKDFLESGHVEETTCLLLDDRTEGMHGLELKRRLVETGRAIPIILLSARATVEEERPEWRAGAADILRKPIRKETLLQAIQLALESPAH